MIKTCDDFWDCLRKITNAYIIERKKLVGACHQDIADIGQALMTEGSIWMGNAYRTTADEAKQVLDEAFAKFRKLGEAHGLQFMERK